MLPPYCPHLWAFAKRGWAQVRRICNLWQDNWLLHRTVNLISWPRDTSDPSAYWWKCSSANQSRKYEKSVREIQFGAGKKSASAAKVWPSDPGFLILLNWLFCSPQERGLAVLRAEFGWITICHNYKWVMIAGCWVPLAAGRLARIMRGLEEEEEKEEEKEKWENLEKEKQVCWKRLQNRSLAWEGVALLPLPENFYLHLDRVPS